MEKSELVDGLTQDILNYVMQGNFPEEELAKNLKPVDLNSRFEDYEKLMDFHFVLREDVVEFVKSLETELRSVKTQTEKRNRVRQGSVDGKINWSATVKERYSRNPENDALFVCQNKRESYDIDENIVLKKLLSIIYHTLKDCEEFFNRNHEWRERWREDRNLVEEMKNIFERNVHIKRIKEPEEYEPTERMLNTAENSRNELYRESTRLLRKRDRIFSGNEEEIRELLNKTAIKPEDEETLLELYVLFRFIGTIEKIESEDFTLETISRSSQRIATMESKDKEIAVYHDSSAKDLDLKFLFDPEEDVNGRSYSRPEKVELKSRDIIEDYFQKDTQQQTGRPDVILVEIKDKEEDKHDYFITEVKNSTREKTIKRGIKEALEYLAFLRKGKNDFIYDDDSPFGGEKSGLVVIQDREEDRDTTSLEEQSGPVRIVEASELEKNLKEIISEKISVQ